MCENKTRTVHFVRYFYQTQIVPLC